MSAETEEASNFLPLENSSNSKSKPNGRRRLIYLAPVLTALALLTGRDKHDAPLPTETRLPVPTPGITVSNTPELPPFRDNFDKLKQRVTENSVPPNQITEPRPSPNSGQSIQSGSNEDSAP